MINLFNNFEALLGRWGEAKRGGWLFYHTFWSWDYRIQAAGKLNSFLLFFLFKCVWSKSFESWLSYIIIASSSQDYDRNYLSCCGDWMWVHKFKFDGGLRKWDQAAAAALSSSMMQFELQVIARILFWTLNNICIYIYIYMVRSELHMILCTTCSIKELDWLYSCRRVSVLLPKFSNTTPYPAVCWLSTFCFSTQLYEVLLHATCVVHLFAQLLPQGKLLFAYFMKHVR